MFSHQNTHAFEDFYDSMKAIQDSHEGFGKEVKHIQCQSQYTRGFKKILSVENFNGVQKNERGMKKSYSNNTFDENDHDFYNYGKVPVNYVYEEQSTMASLSPYNSVGSLSSLVSMGATTPQMMKTKSKLCASKRKMMNSANVSENDFRAKYKTEVCKYFNEYGFCEFGDQCAFAHGKNEVRQRVHVATNYKTKKCVQFHDHGFCPYGARCQFIHCARHAEQLNPTLVNGSYNQDVENAELWCADDADCVCTKRRNKARLPCFANLIN